MFSTFKTSIRRERVRLMLPIQFKEAVMRIWSQELFDQYFPKKIIWELYRSTIKLVMLPRKIARWPRSGSMRWIHPQVRRWDELSWKPGEMLFETNLRFLTQLKCFTMRGWGQDGLGSSQRSSMTVSWELIWISASWRFMSGRLRCGLS